MRWRRAAAPTRRLPASKTPQAFIDGPTTDDVFRLQGPAVPLAGRVSDSSDLPEELAAAWILPDGTRIEVEPDGDGAVSLELPVDDYAIGIHPFELFVVDTTDNSLGSVDTIAARSWGSSGG